ncbi:ABC transporter permease subunit [Thalassorhabdus alkalitolerans]|uniref:ABC transporter permease subunit n=1 Tax=Thalassorhabdus alkalitolerans TaxID=2282697 RepID=A0ABW0YIW4_9BACI
MIFNMNGPLNEWEANLSEAALQTLAAIGVIFLTSLLLGSVLGLFLLTMRSGEGSGKKAVYHGVKVLLAVFYTIPFILLLLVILPGVQFISTPFGWWEVNLLLILIFTSYIGRAIESCYAADNGITEAYEALGVSKKDILLKVLWREKRPIIIRSVTTAAIAVTGAVVIAEIIGGGGLGGLAYHVGYAEEELGLLYTIVSLLILLVLLLKVVGLGLAATGPGRRRR